MFGSTICRKQSITLCSPKGGIYLALCIKKKRKKRAVASFHAGWQVLTSLWGFACTVPATPGLDQLSSKRSTAVWTCYRTHILLQITVFIIAFTHTVIYNWISHEVKPLTWGWFAFARCLILVWGFSLWRALQLIFSICFWSRLSKHRATCKKYKI